MCLRSAFRCGSHRQEPRSTRTNTHPPNNSSRMTNPPDGHAAALFSRPLDGCQPAQSLIRRIEAGRRVAITPTAGTKSRESSFSRSVPMLCVAPCVCPLVGTLRLSDGLAQSCFGVSQDVFPCRPTAPLG